MAIDAAKRANPGAENFVPVGVLDDALGGKLAFVEFEWIDGETTPARSTPDDECVLLGPDNTATILSAEQIARRIKRQFPLSFWRLIGSPASFSGFIALMITCTISYIVLRAETFDVNTVPAVLSGPLAVIVGFYFGRYALMGTAGVRAAAERAIVEFDPSARQVKVKSLVTQFLNGTWRSSAT